MTHCLKTWPEYYKAVTSNQKRFEVRKNDRNFKPGDKLILQEFDPTKKQYTGREEEYRVTYMTEFEQKEGNVVMSIEPWRTYK